MPIKIRKCSTFFKPLIFFLFGLLIVSCAIQPEYFPEDIEDILQNQNEFGRVVDGKFVPVKKVPIVINAEEKHIEYLSNHKCYSVFLRGVIPKNKYTESEFYIRVNGLDKNGNELSNGVKIYLFKIFEESTEFLWVYQTKRSLVFTTNLSLEGDQDLALFVYAMIDIYDFLKITVPIEQF